MKAKTACALAAVVCGVAGCGPSVESDAGMRVTQSKGRLMLLLREQGIKVGRNVADRPPPVRSAFEAFKAFAAVPVAERDLSSDDLNDGLLYEAGVYDWGDAWGETFQLSFVRQYATREGDLQQVELVADFSARVGKGLGASLTWSWDTGGSTSYEHRRSWISAVETSLTFRRVASASPLGYELRQGSAE